MQAIENGSVRTTFMTASYIKPYIGNSLDNCIKRDDVGAVVNYKVFICFKLRKVLHRLIYVMVCFIFLQSRFHIHCRWIRNLDLFLLLLEPETRLKLIHEPYA